MLSEGLFSRERKRFGNSNWPVSVRDVAGSKKPSRDCPAELLAIEDAIKSLVHNSQTLRKRIVFTSKSILIYSYHAASKMSILQNDAERILCELNGNALSDAIKRHESKKITVVQLLPGDGPTSG